VRYVFQELYCKDSVSYLQGINVVGVDLVPQNQILWIFIYWIILSAKRWPQRLVVPGLNGLVI
jgi:hypothetical protein